MYILSLIIFFLSIFIIFFAMIGYPAILKFLDATLKPQKNQKIVTYEPTVSYMIVAHNEENSIKQKLENAILLDYPKSKLQILIASDNSTDKTNLIVEDFIQSHKDFKIILNCSKEHKGKTNAQNETQKIADGEILVMTDANTILHTNAIKELVSYFTDENIAYVCGKLIYTNSNENVTSSSESSYWNLDLSMRDIESRLYSITAGNGALYACRNNLYLELKPISCHDSMMPYLYCKSGYKALFNPDAIAYEKAGETDEDEFKRKVRMNRDILEMLVNGFSVLNPFKYKWFSLFYFGHRTCRYSLWWAHLLLFLSSLIMFIMGKILGWITFIPQFLFWFIVFVSFFIKKQNKLQHFIFYYGMTVLSQIKAVINILTGKSKPIWEKAESTR